MNLIINGTSLEFGDPTNEASYADIVTLAGHDPHRSLSVTYKTKREGDEQRSGILSPGCVIRIEEGMVFNVADTSNS